MGKNNGFLTWERSTARTRPRDERVGDFQEFVEDRPEEVSRAQGGRCMDCGIPFCHQGCPLGNPIPEFNDLVFRGRWKEAWQVLQATNNFPEFTGRLCPAPCEAACVLAFNDQAVTIEQNEKEIIERAFAEGWVQPAVIRQRTGRTIAVVGSGPAGLAAADQLNRAGHTVIVYEKSDHIGGLLRYGIPDFKLEKPIIDRRLRLLETEGVNFRTGVDVGRDIPWDQLLRTHDAVLIAVGCGHPRDLDVPGRGLQGVHFAMDFLSLQNRHVREGGEPALHARDRHVVILGGGDTGSDCLGTSIRQGAAHITQVELMPAPPTERRDDNPWPTWPWVFRTSSSHAEGGDRAFGMMTTEILGDDQGRIRALRCVNVRPTSTPGGPPVEPVPGTERELPCDLLLLAMGFVQPDLSSTVTQLGLRLNRRQLPEQPQAFRTTVDRVYVAGDASRGASLIVHAIAEGREAARLIDADLLAGLPRLPSRGMEQPFL
jgi:glutamate synthase (NADPH/NADH) small chain